MQIEFLSYMGLHGQYTCDNVNKDDLLLFTGTRLLAYSPSVQLPSLRDPLPSLPNPKLSPNRPTPAQRVGL